MRGKFGKWGEAGNGSLIFADLGPTNTGKTHRAIERMLALKKGIIGLPLRLLAREVYDKLVAKTDVRDVALFTGEERILPNRPRYYVCTVESMPMDITVPIVVVDEIQLATHPKRGHIFTDRILNARGTVETWFLGSDTMTDILKTLVPTVDIKSSKRLSPLKYVQPKRLSALPKRTAIVSFNITHLYELADRMRVAKGGVALVMGSMSPQSRNAQVELFQTGKVDTLIATDAIGLGLNLDIRHVCFASLRKFDGKDYRYLSLAEIGQIAGRAGRFKQGGTFNLSVDAASQGGLSNSAVEAIEEQLFAPVRKIYYRNSDISFESLDRFWKTLQKHPFSGRLIPQREALDELTMNYLLKDPEIERLCHRQENLKLLWSVARIPDYAAQSHAHHFRLTKRIFWQLYKEGELSNLWVMREMDKLKNLAGDIPKLLSNMARIRTWNYIAQRPEWLSNGEYWQPLLKDLENKLSQTVHERLTERFIDEMGHAVERSTPQNVYVEGEELWCQSMRLGVLEALSFVSSSTAQAKFGFQTVRALGRQHFMQTAQAVYQQILKRNQWTINEAFQLCYGGYTLADLRKGTSIREPSVHLKSMDLLDAKQRRQVEMNILGWLKTQIQSVFAIYQHTDEHTRTVRYELRKNLGSVAIDKRSRPNAQMRKRLGKLGIVCGKHYMYHRDIYKSKHQWVRFVLYALWNDISILPTLPEHRVCLKERWPKGMAKALGYYQYAGYIIRADVIDIIRWKHAHPLNANTISSKLGLPLAETHKICKAMGIAASESKSPTPNKRRNAK